MQFLLLNLDGRVRALALAFFIGCLQPGIASPVGGKLVAWRKLAVVEQALKYKYGNRHFWCRGYYVDTVGANKEVVARYIQNQLQEDVMADQISFKEYIDPFTGSKNSQA